MVGVCFHRIHLEVSPEAFFFQVFGDEAALYNMEDVQLQDLGQVGEVVITKDDTLFMKVRY